eukprot:gene3725-4294_t
MVFGSVSVEVNNVLEEVLRAQGLTIVDNPEVYDILVFPESERENKIKELRANVDGTELPITEAEASVVDSHWQYRNAQSKAFMEWTANYGLTSCTHDNESGEITSWMIQYTDGNVGALFTLPSHRGRGLAKRVVSDLLLRVLERNVSMPYVFIKDDNVPSQSLFRGLGFKPVTLTRWLIVKND